MPSDADLADLRNALRDAEMRQRWQEIDTLFQRINAIEGLTPEEIGRQAMAAMKSGDKARAATLTRKAVRLAPDSAALRLQLAKIYDAQGRSKIAESTYRSVLKMAPDHVEALGGLAKILQREKERQPEAEALLQHALRLAPENGGLLVQLGTIYANDPHRCAEAEATFLRAMEIDPESATAIHNLGMVYRFAGMLDRAEEFLRRAASLRPRSSQFAFSLGSCLLDKEYLEGALDCFQRAAQLDNKNIDAKVHVAFTLFHMGRTREAWEQYEKRLQLKELKDVNYHRPRWDGGEMNGETLLLIREQGIGDNLQFIRYVPLVAARGARVIVLTPPPLQRLYQSLEGAAAVMPAVPEPRHFHRYCPLMSLPYVFGTDATNVPADVPYLRAPEDVREAWAARLASYPRPRVGLVWRGNPKHSNDHFRSSSLAEMSQLLAIPGISFFSLHKELPEHEQALPDGMVDIGSEFEDFADTAAAMESLDLVISVDTSACHLAGAVGVPVWTILPRSPDFRWGLSGETTPWYPSMRLYRQEVLGNWEPVYARLAGDLGKLAGG